MTKKTRGGRRKKRKTRRKQSKKARRHVGGAPRRRKRGRERTRKYGKWEKRARRRTERNKEALDEAQRVSLGLDPYAQHWHHSTSLGDTNPKNVFFTLWNEWVHSLKGPPEQALEELERGRRGPRPHRRGEPVWDNGWSSAGYPWYFMELGPDGRAKSDCDDRSSRLESGWGKKSKWVANKGEPMVGTQGGRNQRLNNGSYYIKDPPCKFVTNLNKAVNHFFRDNITLPGKNGDFNIRLKKEDGVSLINPFDISDCWSFPNHARIKGHRSFEWASPRYTYTECYNEALTLIRNFQFWIELNPEQKRRWKETSAHGQSVWSETGVEPSKVGITDGDWDAHVEKIKLHKGFGKDSIEILRVMPVQEGYSWSRDFQPRDLEINDWSPRPDMLDNSTIEEFFEMLATKFHTHPIPTPPGPSLRDRRDDERVFTHVGRKKDGAGLSIIFPKSVIKEHFDGNPDDPRMRGGIIKRPSNMDSLTLENWYPFAQQRRAEGQFEDRWHVVGDWSGPTFTELLDSVIDSQTDGGPPHHSGLRIVYSPYLTGQ